MLSTWLELLSNSYRNCSATSIIPESHLAFQELITKIPPSGPELYYQPPREGG